MTELAKKLFEKYGLKAVFAVLLLSGAIWLIRVSPRFM
jgi:hypothetical protein